MTKLIIKKWMMMLKTNEKYTNKSVPSIYHNLCTFFMVTSSFQLKKELYTVLCKETSSSPFIIGKIVPNFKQVSALKAVVIYVTKTIVCVPKMIAWYLVILEGNKTKDDSTE